MAWWIVLGVAVLAVVAFGASVMSLMGRFRPLERSLRRLRLRAEQAERLQTKVFAVRERMAQLRSSVEETQRRRARHHPAPPDASPRRVDGP